jgi:hypothetical protein
MGLGTSLPGFRDTTPSLPSQTIRETRRRSGANSRELYTPPPFTDGPLTTALPALDSA